MEHCQLHGDRMGTRIHVDVDGTSMNPFFLDESDYQFNKMRNKSVYKVRQYPPIFERIDL